MKTLLFTLAVALLSSQAVYAKADVEVLRNNQILVRDVQHGRFVGEPALVTVKGLVGNQTLAAVAHQPATGVLYGFAYNTTTRTGSLYIISQTNFSATLVRSAGVRLPAFKTGRVSMNFIASGSVTVPDLIRLQDGSGNDYTISASNASLVSLNEVQRIPVLGHPYTGASFIDDGTIRNNGIPSNDAQAPTISSMANSSEHDFGASGNAAGALNAEIYPNPAVYQARVVLPDISDVQVTAELLDMNGRLASRTVFPAGRQVLNLDVSRIPAGLYSVRIFYGSTLNTQLKLVRQEQ